MKRTAFAAAATVGTLAAWPAHADDGGACLDAASKGQHLRDSHQLVEARAELRACAATDCPPIVQADCAAWLDAVEKALPTVVVTAKAASGADLVDVKVSVDGQTLVERIDGQAHTMNAGPHLFHFEQAGGSTFERQVMVREGVKNQEVVGTLAPPVAAAAPPPRGWSDPQPARPRAQLGWILAGAGLAGAGLAGLAVGAAFGALAIGDKQSARCGPDGECTAGPLDEAKRDAAASNVGLVAGGVLLAAGVVVVWVAPKERSDRPPVAWSLRIAPSASAAGGRFVVGGTF